MHAILNHAWARPAARRGRTLSLLALIALAWAGPAAAQNINPTTPWPGTDALGRVLPVAGDVAEPQPDRFVGIFYFQWNEHANTKDPSGTGPYDVSKILEADPDAGSKPASPLWGAKGVYHFWAEPLFGYYANDDPWVIRRHAQMLTDAGIDTLIMDATNRITYKHIYMQVLKTYDEMRKNGERTPQICFMLNTRMGDAAQELYNDLYQPGLYPDLWFRWEGKPLIICDPETVTPELKEYFTFRKAHWPFTMVNTPYAWHWEATYPQVYGYTDDPSKPEQVNVSVAQNLSQDPDGHVAPMSSGNARGRSFHDGKQDASPGAIQHGYNFQEQWNRAQELQAPFVLVTSWNEWIAGQWAETGKGLTFVDQYDAEFSRDTEPRKGGHGDNYYMQLVANVRRFKGVAPIPAASAPVEIKIAGPFSQWAAVTPEFRDHTDETLPRDWHGTAGTHYTNLSGRNDLRTMKVARDDRNLYFYAATAKELSPRTDPNWMLLLIDADRNPLTGWAGYDYVVNRTIDPDGSVWLEKNDGGWSWKKVAKAELFALGNELHLSIPREALELPQAGTGFSFDFKWADNPQNPGDVMDFYLSGDVAPEGRFNYRYTVE